MGKEIYLLRSVMNESRADFAKRLRSELPALCSSPELTALWFTVTEPVPPRFHVIPFQKKLIAAVSITTTASDLASRFHTYPGFIGGYRVHEAVPLSHERDWPLGTVTPGVCLLTLFCKQKGLDKSAFLDRWYNGHTPLSLKIHPLSHYVRNEVIGTTTASSPWYDGIVEEHVRNPANLLKSTHFFGGLLRAPLNMLRVYKDISRFIDYSSIRSYVVREYHVIAR